MLLNKINIFSVLVFISLIMKIHSMETYTSLNISSSVHPMVNREMDYTILNIFDKSIHTIYKPIHIIYQPIINNMYRKGTSDSIVSINKYNPSTYHKSFNIKNLRARCLSPDWIGTIFYANCNINHLISKI